MSRRSKKQKKFRITATVTVRDSDVTAAEVKEYVKEALLIPLTTYDEQYGTDLVTWVQNVTVRLPRVGRRRG